MRFHALRNLKSPLLRTLWWVAFRKEKINRGGVEKLCPDYFREYSGFFFSIIGPEIYLPESGYQFLPTYGFLLIYPPPSIL